jgi:hypothetical protein
VLLGTSQPHWWSGRRCVAIERIGDEIAVHDIGAAPGQTSWIRYPLLSDAGPAGHGDGELEVLADSIAEAVSNVLLAKRNDRKSCDFADRIRDLMIVSPGERLISATQRFITLSVEPMTSKDSPDGRWLLTSTAPKCRFYVTAARADIPEVEARIASLLGN